MLDMEMVGTKKLDENLEEKRHFIEKLYSLQELLDDLFLQSHF